MLEVCDVMSDMEKVSREFVSFQRGPGRCLMKLEGSK